MQFQEFDWLSSEGINEPLYNAREIAITNLSSGCSCKAKSARFRNIS